MEFILDVEEPLTVRAHEKAGMGLGCGKRQAPAEEEAFRRLLARGFSVGPSGYCKQV